MPPKPDKTAGRVAIIAGSGALPLAVAEKLQQRGESPFILPLRGLADKRLYAFPHCEISVVEFARLIAALKAEKIRSVVLAGGVRQRPGLRDLRCDLPTLKALPKLFFALRQGDDALLRAFIRLLEGYGFRVAGAQEIAPELLAAKAGRLTQKGAGKSERQNIHAAATAARALGRRDIGQAAVAVGGRVVALEGADGTDALLRRVAELRAAGRLPAGGALVKMKKPQQDMRADLPSIGAETVENARKAGLAGLAVEAGASFILKQSEVIQRADKYGLFIEVL